MREKREKHHAHIRLFCNNMNEENCAEKYFDSNKSRPNKNVSGGYGKYCCIPGCKSQLKTNRKKKNRNFVI